MTNIKKIKLLDNTEYDIVDASATHIQTVTLAQWNLLTPEQQASGDYVVTGITTSPLDASLIPYDNTSSGLIADDVQEAIDELAAGAGGGTAATTTYDNTTSGLTATNVQDALDEVVDDLDDKADRVPLPAEYDSTSTYSVGDYCTYNGNTYECIVNITTAEAWNSAHWWLITPDTDYLHSINPTGNGSFSLNRNTSSTIGVNSVAVGYSCTASGENSHAEGDVTGAGGGSSHAEGSYTSAGGYASHAEGRFSSSSGYAAHAEGVRTTANHRAQHVFGEWNIADSSTASQLLRGNYVEIVGNGTDTDARSNARTLDWSGNEVLSGSLTSDSVTTNAITATTLNGVTIGASPAFTDTTYGLSTSGNDIILSANGTAQDTITVPYATSAGSATKATQDGDGNTISSTYVKVTGDPTIYKNSDMPQGAANLSATATTHRTTVYRNGLSIPYQMDNPNDGGILRVRGTSESTCILELGTWDDSGSGETIQFNYYPTTSQITPTYSASVPKVTGTLGAFTATPVSGKVMVTDGTAGGMKASGYGIAEGNTASTVVARNSSGYIYATYYNASCGVETSSYDSTASSTIYANSDNWLRKAKSITSLYSGALAPYNQCSWTNYKSYKLYIVSMTPDGGNSRYQYAIPSSLFSSSRGNASVYACTSDQYWVVFYLYYSGTTGYCYLGDNNNSSARIKNIYGVN